MYYVYVQLNDFKYYLCLSEYLTISFTLSNIQICNLAASAAAFITKKLNSDSINN